MKIKKNLIALGAALILGLTGCSEQPKVNVEQAGILTTAAISTDKYAGVVVSENVAEITRDEDKKIEELYVSVGDTVRINEKLFAYDTDTLSLDIDKQELEMDKLEQTLKELDAKGKEVEKQIKTEKAKKQKDQDANLLATLEMNLQTIKIELTESNYKKNTLKAEIDYNKDMLNNAVVRSPIKGTIRTIDENGTPYITIQQDGSYQVKGMLSELSLNAGIAEGVNVTILSRTNTTDYWTGVVSLVDYNSTSSNEHDDIYGNIGDGMSTSTNYPFYITLDSTEGLLLGQHVYIQISVPVSGDDVLRIPENYIMDVTLDEETYLTIGTVWGVDMETLTLAKLPVTLGEYDPIYGTYEILDGITAEDYLADPAAEGVAVGTAVVLHSQTEYMGMTEPTGSTDPSGETGASGTDSTASGSTPTDPSGDSDNVG